MGKWVSSSADEGNAGLAAVVDRCGGGGGRSVGEMMV